MVGLGGAPKPPTVPPVPSPNSGCTPRTPSGWDTAQESRAEPNQPARGSASTAGATVRHPGAGQQSAPCRLGLLQPRAALRRRTRMFVPSLSQGGPSREPEKLKGKKKKEPKALENRQISLSRANGAGLGLRQLREGTSLSLGGRRAQARSRSPPAPNFALRTPRSRRPHAGRGAAARALCPPLSPGAPRRHRLSHRCRPSRPPGRLGPVPARLRSRGGGQGRPSE